MPYLDPWAPLPLVCWHWMRGLAQSDPVRFGERTRATEEPPRCFWLEWPKPRWEGEEGQMVQGPGGEGGVSCHFCCPLSLRRLEAIGCPQPGPVGVCPAPGEGSLITEVAPATLLCKACGRRWNVKGKTGRQENRDRMAQK